MSRRGSAEEADHHASPLSPSTPRGPRASAFDALPAGVSGVVTIASLAFAVEPDAGIAHRLAASPVAVATAAVVAVLGLGMLATRLGVGWAGPRWGQARRVVGPALLLAGAAVVSGVSLALAGAALVLVAAYRYVGRYVPAIGVILGSTLIGLVLTMSNPAMTYPWPVLLAMTHVGACRAVVWGLGPRRPRLSVRGVALAAGVIALWSLALVAVAGARGSGLELPAEVRAARATAWVGPAVAGGVMLLAGVAAVAWPRRDKSRATRGKRRAARAAGAASYWHWRGLMMYDAGWLIAAGTPAWGVPLVLLAGSVLTPWVERVRRSRAVTRTR